MHDYDRRRAAAVRTALLEGGPVGRALMKTWNELHDMEYDLKMTLREYGDAAHFSGGPAQHDAQAMIKKIEDVAKQIDHLASHVLTGLTDAEAAFVKKHGEPSAYADDMRKKTFPRSAAVPVTSSDYLKWATLGPRIFF